MRLMQIALASAAIMIFLAGCANNGPSVNWDARVGNYTYDQAVHELGRPDKTLQMSDTSKVAEWQLRSEGERVINSGPTGPGTDNPGGQLYGEPFWSKPEVVQVYPSNPNSGKWLRLTFNPDGHLVAWKSYAQ